MSRRPSYVARNEDDSAVRSTWGGGQRPSVGQSLGINVPLLYEEEDEGQEAMNFRDDNGKKANDIPARLDWQRDLRDFKLQRRQRLWERLFTGVLALTLIIVLLRGRSSGQLFERAKLRVRVSKPPMISSTPLHSFRANFKPGHGYVTSFAYGGLTNQLVELFKLVHLGQRLDRTAVLTDLKAAHSEGGDVPLSTFFDLTAFAYYSNVSMVEWSRVKIPDIPGTLPEKLSCWGWRDERPLERYNVHTDFWPPPGQLTVPSSIETSMTFPAIEVLVSQSQDRWLTETAIRYFGSTENSPAFPDKQLLCFDNLFYVPSTHFVEGSVDRTFAIEEFAPDDPVWAKVGRHLRFSDHINRIADELLESLIGSSSRSFVAIHIRQGDFITLGRTAHSVADAYSAAEKLVQGELAGRKKPGIFSSGTLGNKKLPVVFATDSDDPVFVGKLVELGWIYIDHAEFATTQRFGGWYPGVLDSLILSRSVGFVGTKMSTFSYVAARRVEAWNGGISRIVG